ncbi:hypothetical protein VNO77_04462 [Canavalia gladiata]|uniref:Uncharacterized protein n=1 Tax=Canavalia gladiata TaxID=3824 RepID=A0AAN9MYK6_CANGL
MRSITSQKKSYTVRILVDISCMNYNDLAQVRNSLSSEVDVRHIINEIPSAVGFIPRNARAGVWQANCLGFLETLKSGKLPAVPSPWYSTNPCLEWPCGSPDFNNAHRKPILIPLFGLVMCIPNVVVLLANVGITGQSVGNLNSGKARQLAYDHEIPGYPCYEISLGLQLIHLGTVKGPQDIRFNALEGHEHAQPPQIGSCHMPYSRAHEQGDLMDHASTVGLATIPCTPIHPNWVAFCLNRDSCNEPVGCRWTARAAPAARAGRRVPVGGQIGNGPFGVSSPGVEQSRAESYSWLDCLNLEKWVAEFIPQNWKHMNGLKEKRAYVIRIRDLRLVGGGLTTKPRFCFSHLLNNIHLEAIQGRLTSENHVNSITCFSMHYFKRPHAYLLGCQGLRDTTLCGIQLCNGDLNPCSWLMPMPLTLA